MSYEHITCDLDGAIMTVTLNRPDKLNAHTGQMGAEITHAFNRAAFLEKRPPSFPGKLSQDVPSQYPWWQDQG